MIHYWFCVLCTRFYISQQTGIRGNISLDLIMERLSHKTSGGRTGTLGTLLEAQRAQPPLASPSAPCPYLSLHKLIS